MPTFGTIPSATLAVGDQGTAAWSNQVGSGVGILAAPPIMQCTSTALLTLTTGTNAPVLFGSNTVDTYAGHSTVTNTDRYTAQLDGWYLIIGQVSFVANATGLRFVTIGKNGTAQAASLVAAVPTATAAVVVEASWLLQLATNDYATVIAQQTSGGNLNTSASGSSMQAIWLHT